MQRTDNNGACLAKSWLDTQDDTQCWGSIYPENTQFLKQHAMTSACTRTQFKRTHDTNSVQKGSSKTGIKTYLSMSELSAKTLRETTSNRKAHSSICPSH